MKSNVPTANVVLLSAFPPHNTTLTGDVFLLGNRAIAGEILGDEHLLSSNHSFEALSYIQESSEGHGPPVPWPLQENHAKDNLTHRLEQQS